MIVGLVALVATSLGQSWSTAYEAGLKAAKSGKWADAREAFQQASAIRSEDISAPTVLPGPPSQQRKWRNGAAYSPNFLAAYAEYRLGLSTNDPSGQAEYLKTAAAEFETLVAKGQISGETVFFLGQIYAKTGNIAKRQELDQKLSTAKATWKVDTEVISPEENSAVASIAGGTPTTPITTTSGPIVNAGQPAVRGGAPVTGTVLPVMSKFALVISQSTGKLADGQLSFASNDAKIVREALTTNAGYPDANIDVIENATAPQILASVKAISDRIPENGTLVIYYTGAGTNIGGKDYLAGVDAEILTDTSALVSKSEIYKPFIAKGVRIFAFYQVARPVNGGRYFGQEIPAVGIISQMQATIPGGGILPTFRNGKQVGAFTLAISDALTDLRTNQLPIMEFGWQVFYKIRRGQTGVTGGASEQTPTLPVLSNMADDAKF